MNYNIYTQPLLHKSSSQTSKYTRITWKTCEKRNATLDMFCSRFYVKRERKYYVLSEKHNVEPQEEEKDKYQTRSVFLVT